MIFQTKSKGCDVYTPLQCQQCEKLANVSLYMESANVSFNISSRNRIRTAVRLTAVVVSLITFFLKVTYRTFNFELKLEHQCVFVYECIYLNTTLLIVSDSTKDLCFIFFPRRNKSPKYELTEIPPILTFGNEGSQKASWWTWAKSLEQRAADHWWVCVGACIHHRVSRNKIGGLLGDIWSGAAPYHHLDLVHIQVLEREDQNMCMHRSVITHMH